MKDALNRRIQALKVTTSLPAGGSCDGLSLEAVRNVAREAGVSPREVEIAALQGGVVPVRYLRNIGSIGTEGQIKLLLARVAVIGAGGLGGTVIELLARAGVGRLVIIDGEVFTEDNLNRQLLLTEEAVGCAKADAALRRVKEVNSAVEVEQHKLFIDENNVDPLLCGTDLVIDALDSIPVRLLLQESCARQSLALIHGAIAGFYGEVMTVLPGDSGMKCLYGDARTVPQRGIETEFGTPTATPAVIAALQVVEALKLLLGRGTPLRERLLFLDLLETRTTMITLDPGRITGEDV